MVCAIPNTENVSFQYNFRTYYAHGVSHALSLRDDCVQNESEEAIGTQSDCNYQGIPGYLVKCDIENKINSFSMQDDDDSILQDSDLQVSYFQEEREAFVNNCKVQLLNSIIGDEFIDGEISRTEIIVKEMFKRGREAVMSALMDIYLEYFSEQDIHVLKDESIEHIENIEDNDFLHQSADVPTTEFRTKHSTLSTYMIDNLNELDKAVLAIATTSSKISSMEFIILDAEILKAIGLKYENTYPGMEIPYEEMQEFHYDIVDVTIENLAKCLEAYKKTLQLDDNKSTFIVDYAEGKIKDLIKTALKQEKFNIEKVPVELNKAVQKLQKELH